MLEGKPAIGAELGLGSPLAAEMLLELAFDFVVVDNQHGSWADDSTMQAFRSIALGDAVPMARVRHNDFSAIGRLLDQGALGIVVPMVNSAEEAEAAAFAARYPPKGGRSGGHFGAVFYGSDYVSRANDELFLAVQIETATGLENAEEIMSADGVDGCWVGPHDLSMSMGLDLETPEGRAAHTDAIQSIVDVCKKTGKVPGISTAALSDSRLWLDRGCLFVTVGNDVEWLGDGAQETLRQLGRCRKVL